MSGMESTLPVSPETLDTHGALYKSIGVTLAVASGVFIGSSFVFKKKGLLDSNARSGNAAGEGYGYLKSAMWWTGMILMVVGEACNFVAYAFAPAILVTPLGALSVVLSAVLSSIFLKEGLTFQGIIGCIQCVLGAIIIVLHAPEEGAADNSIATFRTLMLSTGFMTYSVFAVGLSLFLVFYCGPRWGNKNMLVYITVCSLIGSLSVVFTQGIGGTIVHSLAVENQFDDWFVYLVLALTIVTLMVEIIYLNKALNIFNTALVTPTYYVIFTTLTIVSATVLYRGFEASGTDVASCVFGFLIICSGVALLHHSRSQPQHHQPLGDGSDESSMESGNAIHMNGNIIGGGNNNDRRNSLLHLFDNEKYMNSDDDDHEHDEYDHMLPQNGMDQPGPADLFPKPLVGAGRYASTSRKSLTLSRRSKTSMDDYNGIELVPASHQQYTETFSMDKVPSKKSQSKKPGKTIYIYIVGG
ncbi:magnesium transporter NIPA-domain-containing protein [Absidia repens]|uniref:Magnesium transporter NIPA-domain-containing protein n=1 Tax=Absidia repens TaxID=90262 RepID=A0A1X2IGZ6_9FUNG|nr:magnesium transporter NIPA-domain-containing protein [Absidia repens]